ncbi:DUF2946 family protein [Arenibaculum sp.]|jgi:hypothetical protein|uniref:DUF2946 family protein n=1 Tax=Arenibaculum sp. TaxID=2865862 RepID=UPI002E0E5658|nr:DUF2946 family protein [Arenibaculum sp.]
MIAERRGSGMAGNGTWAGRVASLVAAAFLLRLLLLPVFAVPGHAAPAYEHAGHAAHAPAQAHAAAEHEAPRGGGDHHAGAQACHFCRFDAPSLPPPAAPALGPRLRPASPPPPRRRPPRLRDLAIRVRARAPPPSA